MNEIDDLDFTVDEGAILRELAEAQAQGQVFLPIVPLPPPTLESYLDDLLGT